MDQYRGIYLVEIFYYDLKYFLLRTHVRLLQILPDVIISVKILNTSC